MPTSLPERSLTQGAIVATVAALVLLPSCYCSHALPDVGTDAPARLDAPADVPPDVPSFDAGPLCHVASSNASLLGSSPLGPVDLRFGFAGRGNTSKACFGVAIHWTEAGTLHGPPTRQAYVWLPRPSAEPIVGLHRGVTLLVVDGDRMAMTDQAEVTVTSYTRDEVDPAIDAAIRVSAPGWELTGTISAPHCIVFADPCL